MIAHSIRCDCTLCKWDRDRPRTATHTTKETPKARIRANRAATKTEKKKKTK